MRPRADPPLATREGLPPEIAYLRASFPQPQWRGHANFGELAAFWLQIHDGLRSHGAELGRVTEAFRQGALSAADFPGVFVPRFNHFLQHLQGHHQIEDQAYFPRFRALDPRMVAGFDLLENDHGLIHETMVASVEGAKALLAALSDRDDARRGAADAYAAVSGRLLELLLRHLADEEELVIPALLEHGERSVG